MGISLNGLTPAGTYPGLIKTGDNTAISGTPKVLSDGNGNNLPMEVSTTEVNFTNQLKQGGVAVPTASQVSAKQDTLVSGTNIKTINGASVLGSGNIVTPSTPPSGVSGAIQFSNGSAFASDAANFFWDDANNRLGVLTNTPSFPVDVAGEIRSTTQVSAGTMGTNGAFLLRRTTDGNSVGSFSTSGNEVLITEFSGSGGRLVTGFATTALKWLGSSSQPRVGIGFNGSILATAHIQGSGATSATTSLLVQNSAGSSALSIKDDGYVTAHVGLFSLGALTGVNVAASNILYNAKFWNQADGGTTIGAQAAPAASSILDIRSTTSGVLFPRMTTTQKNAIASPAAGLVVYDSTTNKLCCYNGSTWNDLF
jgi:hypothetical protein